MIERFKGKKGEQQVLELIMRQTIVERDKHVGHQLFKAAKLREFKPGEDLIKFGGSDTHLDMILVGEVEIIIKGQRRATRGPGTHVGEMALIDPAAPRSATVRAIETTVVARVPPEVVRRCASAAVWLAMAQELARRLRERTVVLRASNDSPIVFVGSSVERLSIARKLQKLLEVDFTVQIWTDDVFGATGVTVDDLNAAMRKADFAAFVVHPDDVAVSRHAKYLVPRDNVILELGMALAVLDRDRTVFIKPRGVKAKLPSDLLGLKPLEYRDGSDESTLAARLGPVASSIRDQLNKLGVR